MLGTAGSLEWTKREDVGDSVTNKASGPHWQGPDVFMWAAASGRRGHHRTGSPVKMEEGRSERETAGKEVDATGQQEMEG